MLSKDVHPEASNASCEMACTSNVPSPNPSMLMAVPRNTSNTSPVSGSTMAKLVTALCASLWCVNPTMAGPMSVQNTVLAGLFSAK